MQLNDFSQPPAISYSKKLIQAIENPKNVGFFSQEEALAKNLRLVIGKGGKKEEGEAVSLYLLVDESDGIVADAKFQVFGPSYLIGAAETICELAIRKNYEQLRRITADFLDKHLRDKKECPAFPETASKALNLVISALEAVSEQCLDIPFIEHYVSPPLDMMEYTEEGQSYYPHWMELEISQKMAVLEEIIAEHVRPYIELDAGGIHLLNIVNEKEVIIGYEGSCTSCYSATGATLNAIQQILRTKVHPGIIVIPDLSFLENRS
jgi:NifU-like protein